ncbi:MAG: TlpA family protein disulfide reductase [Bradyrhizobiaceae bacterium]|nr:MAG: TlpA family protein disulfide reductase [Bradyrhizobiaceae bacterium]
MTDKDQPRTARRRFPITFAAVVIAVLAGCLGIYGIGGLIRNASGDPACQPATDLAKKIAPLAQGEVAALTMATAPLRIPDLSFNDGAGKTRQLSEWRGKTVLVNLWATWCVPCRKEMPALDELQGKLGGPKFDVVAINIDTRDPERPRNFLKDANLTHLGFFTDVRAKVFQDLKNIGRALGMPTSVLIDGEGCEIATIAGPAEWASDDAINLIKAASGQ